ncbi:MAG: hypothetical protein ACOCSE_04600, partial [Chitinivibrionales bacterium]
MLFSKKKNQIKDPAVLADELENNYDKITGIFEKIQSERESLTQLVESVNDEREYISGISDTVTEVSDSIKEMLEGYHKIQEHSGEFEKQQKLAEERLGRTEELNTRLKRLEDALSKASLSEDYIQGLEEKADTMIDKLRNAADDSKVVEGAQAVIEVEKQAEKVSGKLEDMNGTASGVDERIAEINKRLEGVSDRAEELDTKQEELQEVNKKNRIAKEKLDSLNSMVEYVKQKMKGLERQKSVVEKANEESGRLNALTWQIDSDIKALQAKQNE